MSEQLFIYPIDVTESGIVMPFRPEIGYNDFIPFGKLIFMLEQTHILPIEVTESGIVMSEQLLNPPMEVTESGIVMSEQQFIFRIDVTESGIVMLEQLRNPPIEVTESGMAVLLRPDISPNVFIPRGKFIFTFEQSDITIFSIIIPFIAILEHS